MSNLVFIVYMFLLSLHACTARHGFDLVSYSKDEEKTNLVHETFSMFEDTSSAGRTEDTPIATLQWSLRPPIELKGLKVNPSRSMLESKSHENKHETTDTPEESQHDVEDAVVMDYVAPRRKSPIHNHH